jgi:hypothetical protein
MPLHEVPYFVRQIEIAHGCINFCTHCFAAPPQQIEQMDLSGFSLLAKEFGDVARIKQDEYTFLYLGATTDPAVVRNFYRYLEIWIKSLPQWHYVKVYSHGWQLWFSRQKQEYSRLLNILSKYKARIKTFGLSVDLFSLSARREWVSYLKNLAENLMGLLDALSIEQVKLQITYPLERLDADQEYCIQYYRDKTINSRDFPDDKKIDELITKGLSTKYEEIARLTKGVFLIGDMAGLSRFQTSYISRDGGIPFASGRARTFYKKSNVHAAQQALESQQEHTLYSLKDYIFGNNGLLIMPNGSLRLVDYLGFKLGEKLKNGEVVVPYLSSKIAMSTPWPIL